MHHVFFVHPWQVYTVGGVILTLLVLAVANAFWFDVQKNKPRRTSAQVYNRQQARKRSEEEQYWHDHRV